MRREGFRIIFQNEIWGGNTSTKRIPQPSRTWELISLDMGWNKVRTGVVFSLCKEGPSLSFGVAHLSAPRRVTGPVHSVNRVVAHCSCQADFTGWMLMEPTTWFYVQVLNTDPPEPGCLPSTGGEKGTSYWWQKGKESALVYSGMSDSRWRGVGLQRELCWNYPNVCFVGSFR